VRLTPGERDRLLVFAAAELARSRRSRGLRLNAPEATALIADAVAEAARDGKRLAEAVDVGRHVLGPADVLDGVPAVVDEVRVEATFDDGTRLVVVPDPFRVGEGDTEAVPQAPAAAHGRRVDAVVDVTNESPVPISVSSHVHFFEVNPRLRFRRATGYGRHLAVAAGTTVRFEPGATRRVELRDIGGGRVVIGFAGLVDGPLDAPGAKDEAMARARALGYLDQ
jgi:urease subunit gamma/beta